MMSSGRVRVVGLVSGGLDSILAARVMRDIGAEVHLVHFRTACWSYDRSSDDPRPSPTDRLKQLDLPVTIVDVTEEYLDLLRNPRYGRGSAFNPCIDCKVFLLTKAREIMEQIDGELVFTGEVIGQRPMSQNRGAMRIVERDSGLEERLLRPLCAHSLAPTVPEQEGRIDRARLLNFNGRSRKPQLALAKELGMDQIPPVGGGCILTDKRFGDRMFDLLSYGQFDLSNILLAKVGRHFRLSDAAKVVVGRNETENGRITALAEPGDRLIELEDIPGPTSLLRGRVDKEHIMQAAVLTRRYGDCEEGQRVTLNITTPGGRTEVLILEGFPPSNLTPQRI